MKEASDRALGMPRQARRSFLLFFATVAALFGWFVLRPLLAPIVLAALTAVLFDPFHRRIEQRLGIQTVRAAACSLSIVVLVFGAPVLAFSFLFVAQLRSVLGELLGADTGAPASRLSEVVEQYLDWSDGIATRYLGGVDIRASGQEAIQDLTGQLYAGLPDLVAYLGHVLLAFLVLAIALFLLFLRGRRVTRLLRELSPLDELRTQSVLHRLVQMVRGVFVGSLLTVAVQGLLGGVAFFLTDFPNYVVWGVLIAGAGLIPVVGTALVWLPAAAFLLLTGEIGSGLLIVAAGLIISSVDNVIRSFLIGVRATIHPLVIFLAVLGGIQTAGPMGIVYGPLLAALVIEAVGIYTTDLRATGVADERPE